MSSYFSHLRPCRCCLPSGHAWSSPRCKPPHFVPSSRKTSDPLADTACRLSSACRNNPHWRVCFSSIRSCSWSAHPQWGCHRGNVGFLEDFRFCHQDQCDGPGDCDCGIRASSTSLGSWEGDGETRRNVGKLRQDSGDQDDWHPQKNISQPGNRG